MQLYAVKLLPGHLAEPENFVDGYVGYGNIKRIKAYTRGWAQKKARVFKGKMEKFGKEYNIDTKQTIIIILSELHPETKWCLMINPEDVIDCESMLSNIEYILDRERRKVPLIDEVKTELICLYELIVPYDYVRFE